jgi:hypothetical protein
MQTRLFFSWLTAITLCLVSQFAAHASHILGGDISYSPVTSTSGAPRYHISVRLYRDATAAVDQRDIEIMCSRNGCGTMATGSFKRTLPLSQRLNGTSLGCTNANSFGYEILLFETDEDLPAGQWTLSVYVENRAANIINMAYSERQTFYVSSFLDNATVKENTSPKFLSTLLPYLCGNSAQRYSFSAFDSEGDSLTYNLISPQGGVQPQGVCGEDIPGDLAPYFQLNKATGGLTTRETTVRAGRYSMAARINEYRRVGGTWQLIGGVTRDVSYIAYASANKSPRFTGLSLGSSTTPQPVEQLIQVKPGQTLSMLLSATDPDAGQTLSFSSQAPDVVPGLSLVTLGPTQARLTWQVPTGLPLGRYTATVAVVDNGCPLHASEEQTLTFLVSNQTLAARPAINTETTAFPMPFRDQVQFRAASGGQLVLITDELGREVSRLRSQPDGRVLWQPATNLPAGLYLARAADGRPLARLLRAAN